MTPNRDLIYKLMREKNWSGSELARQMGVSRAEANRLLSGRRDGGKKCISGLMKAFPSVPIEVLFIME